MNIMAARNTCLLVIRFFFIFLCIVPAKIDTSDVLSNPEVIVNHTITLHCPASGIPLPDVGWFRDGEPVNEELANVKILDSGWRLQIKNAEASHAARYTCRAKNIAGESEKNYELSVLGKYDRPFQFRSRTTLTIQLSICQTKRLQKSARDRHQLVFINLD